MISNLCASAICNSEGPVLRGLQRFWDAHSGSRRSHVVPILQPCST